MKVILQVIIAEYVSDCQWSQRLCIRQGRYCIDFNKCGRSVVINLLATMSFETWDYYYTNDESIINKSISVINGCKSVQNDKEEGMDSDEKIEMYC